MVQRRVHSTKFCKDTQHSMRAGIPELFWEGEPFQVGGEKWRHSPPIASILLPWSRMSLKRRDHLHTVVRLSAKLHASHSLKLCHWYHLSLLFLCNRSKAQSQKTVIYMVMKQPVVHNLCTAFPQGLKYPVRSKQEDHRDCKHFYGSMQQRQENKLRLCVWFSLKYTTPLLWRMTKTSCSPLFMLSCSQWFSVGESLKTIKSCNCNN